MATSRYIQKVIADIRQLHLAGTSQPQLVLAALLKSYCGGDSKLGQFLASKTRSHIELIKNIFPDFQVNQMSAQMHRLDAALTALPRDNRSGIVVALTTGELGKPKYDPSGDLHALLTAFFYFYPWMFDSADKKLKDVQYKKPELHADKTSSILKECWILAAIMHEKDVDQTAERLMDFIFSYLCKGDIFPIQEKLTKKIMKEIMRDDAKRKKEDKKTFIKDDVGRAVEALGKLKISSPVVRARAIELLKECTLTSITELAITAACALTRLGERLDEQSISFYVNCLFGRLTKAYKPLSEQDEENMFQQLVTIISASKQNFFFMMDKIQDGARHYPTHHFSFYHTLKNARDQDAKNYEAQKRKIEKNLKKLAAVLNISIPKKIMIDDLWVFATHNDASAEQVVDAPDVNERQDRAYVQRVSEGMADLMQGPQEPAQNVEKVLDQLISLDKTIPAEMSVALQLLKQLREVKLDDLPTHIANNVITVLVQHVFAFPCHMSLVRSVMLRQQFPELSKPVTAGIHIFQSDPVCALILNFSITKPELQEALLLQLSQRMFENNASAFFPMYVRLQIKYQKYNPKTLAKVLYSGPWAHNVEEKAAFLNLAVHEEKAAFLMLAAHHGESCLVIIDFLLQMTGFSFSGQNRSTFLLRLNRIEEISRYLKPDAKIALITKLEEMRSNFVRAQPEKLTSLLKSDVKTAVMTRKNQIEREIASPGLVTVQSIYKRYKNECALLELTLLIDRLKKSLEVQRMVLYRFDDMQIDIRREVLMPLLSFRS